MGQGLLIHEVSRSHTTTHHSRQDSSGRVISPTQRSLPDNTQHSQQTNIHDPGGIRTHNLSRRAAEDLRLRPRGHWDRQIKRKDVPRQAELALGVPGSLRTRMCLKFGHYKGGRSSAKHTGRLYPRRNPWYLLSDAESTSGHMVLSGVPRKKSPVTPPGIDPGTVRLIAQCLNHYTTSGPRRRI